MKTFLALFVMTIAVAFAACSDDRDTAVIAAKAVAYVRSEMVDTTGAMAVADSVRFSGDTAITRVRLKAASAPSAVRADVYLIERDGQWVPVTGDPDDIRMILD